VGEVAFNVTSVVAHVMGPDTDGVTPGLVILCVTFTVAVEVHPFTGFVTFSVYPPGAVIAGFCTIDTKLVPIHRKVAPLIGVLASSVTDVLAQSSACETLAVAPGSAISWVTSTEVVEAQAASDDLVTVSVYVPGREATICGSMEEYPSGPDHR
jgi:hypothetical protein